MMRNIREDLNRILFNKEEHSDNEKSIMIIMYLENHLDIRLERNGWLDNDPESKEALFGNDYGLSDKLSKILGE